MRIPGISLLVTVTLILFVSHVCRGRLIQPAPAFLSAVRSDMRLVELGAGFCPEGVHQFIDGTPADDVNKLATCRNADQGLLAVQNNIPLQQGERLEITQKAGQQVHLQRSWMTAAKRFTLGIRLRPDSMTYNDWLDIPGIGPAIANKIEMDRQNNGEIECLNDLERVPGVGMLRIEQLEPFFDK